MQSAVDTGGLQHFDGTFMLMEMELLPTWFLQRHLGFAGSDDDRATLERAFDFIVQSALAQPQAFMHRDYHSRNLLIAGADVATSAPGGLPNPAIIDFQGAFVGPITYDLASLLRDCYIEWDAARVDAWMESHRQRLRDLQLIETDVDTPQFRRWFDLIGLQRHIKVLGIFCRLWYRDGKPSYLADLPLVWRYVITVAQRYPELAALVALLQCARGGRDLTLARDEADA